MARAPSTAVLVLRRGRTRVRCSRAGRRALRTGSGLRPRRAGAGGGWRSLSVDRAPSKPGWQESSRPEVGLAPGHREQLVAQVRGRMPAPHGTIMLGWLRRQGATFPVMPAAEAMQDTRPVTRSDLARDLRGLGVRPGGVLMVHTRMSAIGWVVGGAQTVVTALLDVLGPAGTLMAYVGWNDSTGGMIRWPREWQEAYRAECAPFDPQFSETDRQMGRVPERIRTWPGAKVSGSHFRRMTAIGAAAGWLTEDQPWHHGFGPGSPLAKLVEADGQVLLLGAPLDRLTILHHAESLVDSPQKRMARHVIPVREGGEGVWRDVFDHDTSTALGAFPYERAVGDQDSFAVIGQLALDAGCGGSGLGGKAVSHLFPAGPLVCFGIEWLSREFGPERSPEQE